MTSYLHHITGAYTMRNMIYTTDVLIIYSSEKIQNITQPTIINQEFSKINQSMAHPS